MTINFAAASLATGGAGSEQQAILNPFKTLQHWWGIRC